MSPTEGPRALTAPIVLADWSGHSNRRRLESPPDGTRRSGARPLAGGGAGGGPAPEALDLAAGVHDPLGPGEERVAERADLGLQLRERRARQERVAADAGHDGIGVELGGQGSFHGQARTEGNGTHRGYHGARESKRAWGWCFAPARSARTPTPHAGPGPGRCAPGREKYPWATQGKRGRTVSRAAAMPTPGSISGSSSMSQSWSTLRLRHWIWSTPISVQAARVASSSSGVSVTPGKASRLRQTWPPARFTIRPHSSTSSSPYPMGR